MIQEVDAGLFREAKFLQHLNLEGNWIARIHSRAMTGLHKLSTLDLRFNNLEELNPRILYPVEKKLSRLQLKGEADTTKTNFDLTALLNFSGNPWRCDCDNVPLWSWLQNHSTLLRDTDPFVCDAPEVS